MIRVYVYTTPCTPQLWCAYVRKRPDIYLLYLAFSLSRCYPIYIYLSLLSPIYSLSSSLSIYIYTYGYSLCNKSPLPTPGGGGRALTATSRIGSVSTPYQRSGGKPHPGCGRRERGYFLSLNGYDEGRAHIVVVAILATRLLSTTPRARRERASALCVSLSSGTFLPPRSIPFCRSRCRISYSRHIECYVTHIQRGDIRAISQSG